MSNNKYWERSNRIRFAPFGSYGLQYQCFECGSMFSSATLEAFQKKHSLPAEDCPVCYESPEKEYDDYKYPFKHLWPKEGEEKASIILQDGTVIS